MKYNGTTYETENLEVAQALEAVRESGDRIRIWYGNPSTGRSWEEQWDIIGTVSRSTGPTKVPILLKSKRSQSGGEILAGSIVRIVRTKGNRVLYQHPKFYQPEYTIHPAEKSTEGLKFFARANDINVAGFYTREEAQRWVDFMLGKRHTTGGRI